MGLDKGLPRGETALTFASLPMTSLYQRGNGAIYPQVDISAPIYVVATAKLFNAVGNNYITNNYKYGGLKAEVGTGRGLLGFGWMEVVQAETGITKRTEYRQDWPYVGLPSLVKKTLAGSGNNGVLGQTDFTYGCLNPQLGSACTVSTGNRYFPYVSQSVETGWDLNGTALPTVTTTNQFDSYGNATQVGVSTSDGYGKTTTNTYQNDTTNWFLGRLQRSQVQSVTP